MLDFITACVGLFDHTFTAAISVPFFKFFSGLLILQLGGWCFAALARTARRL